MSKYYEWEEDILGPVSFEWDWPQDVPRDFTALHEQYGGFVAGKLRGFNKVEGNFQDLLQEVWMRMVGADLLNKFVVSGARRLPGLMTADEACLFLGISFKQWCNTLARQPWRIKPIEGTIHSHVALYATVDLIDMDNSLSIDEKDVDHSPWRIRSRRVRPQMTARGFHAYLEQSVRNAFANFCRTKNRKHRDHPISATANLIATSSGEFKRSVDLEDQTSWEDGLAVAMTLDEEDAIDLSRLVRKACIDLDSEEGAEVLDYLLHQGRACDDGPQRNMDTLVLMGQGYSLSEAIVKVKARSRERTRRRQIVATTG